MNAGMGIMTFMRWGCSLMNALFNWFSMIFTAGVALNVCVKAWKMDSTASWTG